MFPKGPRFDPLKIPDVPGPNSYNLPQESQLDAYKRGAFLEKTDRFSKDKEPEVPGPCTYKTETSKPDPRSVGQPPNLANRYMSLQRKVEELERLHNDGKKSHQAENERLKSELLRSQKTSAEQGERLEKQKKLSEALDIRLQELKKNASIDQAEIKDLRAKLRMSEHERAQQAVKQGEVADLKKALQVLDLKRKDELRERDRKIAELEKATAMEKKKREGTEAKLQEIKGKLDEEVQVSRTAAQALQTQMATAQDEVRRAQLSLTELQTKSGFKEEGLIAQLEQYRAMLGKAAEEYGRLASASVPMSAHQLAKQENTALQMRLLRLERKLTNSEGQVVELAHLIRYTKEENIFLNALLRDAQAESSYYSSALNAMKVDINDELGCHNMETIALDRDAALISRQILDSNGQTQDICQQTTEVFREFYRLTCSELLLNYSIVEEALQEEEKLVRKHVADLASAVSTQESFNFQVETARVAAKTAQEQIRILTTIIEETKATTVLLEQRLADTESEMHKRASTSEELLKKEREAARHLQVTVQKSRMAEEALRVEIEQLAVELTDAEKYQEAYYSLLDEVGSLVARNALAENEAQRLSQFNAEILGHNNPAQRIMYVDRIRKELAETKHQLLTSTRNHEAATRENAELRQEIKMYTSVMVPIENKPRTNITRIGRAPLANLAQSLNAGTNISADSCRSEYSEKGSRMHVLETIPGDMTLEEII